jgi:hypothetical protein
LIRVRVHAISALLVAILAGCGSQGTAGSSDPSSSHLRWLLMFRTQAISQGQVPKNEEDFKRFINSLDTAALDRVKAASGVSNIEELFASERDGQPYVFFYGQPPAGVTGDVVAYEQSGIDGKRFVGYSLGAVAEVDEQKFDELVPPAARPTQ